MSYGLLERRQLLAVTGLAQFDGDNTINTGLIANGDFDANAVAEASSEHVLLTGIDGWSQSTGASETVSLVGFDAAARGTALHLDFDANAVESVFQDIDTESDQVYTLAFDLLGREVDATADATTNEIRVNWDGQEVGRFKGISLWQTFVVDVTGSSSDLTRLEIQEIDGAGNDGIGPIIDNIRLVPVTGVTVENGSFEDNASGTVAQDDLPGWSVVADASNESVEILDGSASDGTRFLNLDRSGDRSDILFTNVATESGGVYFISFDMRSESGDVSTDEEIRVRWNDQWAGTYRADSDWQNYGITVRADSDSTRLVFREAGDGFTGDGSGPLLDNVRIMQVNPALSFSLADTLSFDVQENAVDQRIIADSLLAINSSINEATLTQATVSLDSSADLSTESLSVTIVEDGSTTTQESENGVLTVTGERTISEYLTILRSLAYSNTSDNPSTDAREITVTVSSGSVTSPPATFTVNMVPVNDAPSIESIENTVAVVDDPFSIQANATDPEAETITWTVSATGTAVESGDSLPTIDNSGLLQWTPARVGTAEFTVRATDASGAFDETQFTVTTSLSQPLDTGTVVVNAGSALPLYDSGAATDAAVGQTIADFEAQTINGETFNSFEPGVARIYGMFAHWCPACNAELPEVSQWLLENDLGDDIEFVAAAVEVDSTRANYPPSTWFSDNGFTGTIIVDNPQSRIMELMGTQSFPFLVAVDANGRVVERIPGITTEAQLDSVLQQLRA